MRHSPALPRSFPAILAHPCHQLIPLARLADCHCSPTLFATSQGRVFSDLRGAPVEASDLVSEPEAVPAHAMVHKVCVGGG